MRSDMTEDPSAVGGSPGGAPGAIPAASAGGGAIRDAGPGRVATLLLVSSLTIMASTVISPGLPGMEAALAGDDPRAALMIRLALSLPGLFVALCAPLVGWVADRRGRRVIMLAGIVLYALAGTSGLWVEGLEALLIGRAFLGVSVAMLMTAASAMAGDLFTGPTREKFLGLQSSSMGLAGLVFLTCGGMLAETGWRAPFAIYGAALAILPAALILLPETLRRAAPAVPAGPMAAPAGPEARAIGPGVALLVFIALANSVLFYFLPVQLPFLLRHIGVAGPGDAGLALGVFTLMSSAASLLCARIRRRVSAGGVFGLAFAVMALGFVVIAMAERMDGGLIQVGLGAALSGLGVGLVMPTLFNTAIGLAPVAQRGRVAGMTTAGVFLGQFLSPMVSQPGADAWGYPGAFLGGAVLLLAMAAVGLGARRLLAGG